MTRGDCLIIFIFFLLATGLEMRSFLCYGSLYLVMNVVNYTNDYGLGLYSRVCNGLFWFGRQVL